jgi:hypothetical protein
VAAKQALLKEVCATQESCDAATTLELALLDVLPGPVKVILAPFSEHTTALYGLSSEHAAAVGTLCRPDAALEDKARARELLRPAFLAVMKKKADKAVLAKNGATVLILLVPPHVPGRNAPLQQLCEEVAKSINDAHGRNIVIVSSITRTTQQPPAAQQPAHDNEAKQEKEIATAAASLAIDPSIVTSETIAEIVILDDFVKRVVTLDASARCATFAGARAPICAVAMCGTITFQTW